jgi:hypothetical protein
MLSKSEIVARSVAIPSPKVGVYFLITEADEVLYVGQSVDIEARVRIWSQRKKFIKWAWVPCQKAEMEELERAYITALDPSGNTDPITMTARGGPKKPRVLQSTWGRRIMTPQGSFPSITAAAKHFGISKQAAWQRASRASGGWKFLRARATVEPSTP